MRFRLTVWCAVAVLAMSARAADYLLFAGGEPSGGVGLWIAKPDGSEPRLITDQATGWNVCPSASSDGARIAFVSTREAQDEEIFVMTPGGGIERITENPGTDREPSISPDGLMVAFVSMRDDRAGDLYTTLVGEQGVVRLTEGMAAESPAFSPDGRTIVFSGKPLGGERAIWTCSASGQERRLLVQTDYADREPVLSPDGLTVYFVSGAGAEFGVYSASVADAKPKLLLAFPGVARPSVSPDGNMIAFTSDFEGGIYVAPVDGSTYGRVSAGTDPTWITIPEH